MDIASAASTAFCADPLNIQAANRADAPSTSNAGVVTCNPATLNCGVGYFVYLFTIKIINY